MKYDTKREACESWVREMNQFPLDMIRKVIEADGYTTWREITPPTKCDRVYIFFNQMEGEIIGTYTNEDDETILNIKLDNGEIINTTSDEIEVQYDDLLPMWGWMWQFSDNCDDWWLEEHLQEMTDCGFRIYEHEEFGYFFGIDGAGYSFYEAHWLPLYDIRGLNWHKEE